MQQLIALFEAFTKNFQIISGIFIDKAILFDYNKIEIQNSQEKRKAARFDDLDQYKTEIGNGAVICMANDWPIDKKNWCVPAWLI